MTSGKGLSVGVVALVAAALTAVSTILWMWLTGRGDLVPSPSWFSVGIMLVLAGGILAFAWPVRAHVRRSAKRMLDPIRAARTLVLAQAGALTGAAVLGWHLGQLVNLLRDLDLMVNHPTTWRVALAMAAALVLVVAGLLAQSWCRLPPSDPRNPRDLRDPGEAGADGDLPASHA